jgi:hypothetical protein
MCEGIFSFLAPSFMIPDAHTLHFIYLQTTIDKRNFQTCSYESEMYFLYALLYFIQIVKSAELFIKMVV